MDKKIPDTSEAESWVDPDVFRWNGQLWRILINGQVVKEKNGK